MLEHMFPPQDLQWQPMPDSPDGLVATTHLAGEELGLFHEDDHWTVRPHEEGTWGEPAYQAHSMTALVYTLANQAIPT